VNRYAVLYIATLMILLPLDLLFLGVLAKGLFVSEVGDMLGEVRGNRHELPHGSDQRARL